MQSYFDSRDGKTHCGRCDSASWCSIGVCTDCEQACCDDCAESIGQGTRSELLCSQCALKRALESEVGASAEELEAEYGLVEPMQAALFPEMQPKPARVQISPIYREVA